MRSPRSRSLRVALALGTPVFVLLRPALARAAPAAAGSALDEAFMRPMTLVVVLAWQRCCRSRS
ncbi:MAG: hypothetical protein WDO74_11610 [Pseudomonadota bacterium]